MKDTDNGKYEIIPDLLYQSSRRYPNAIFIQDFEGKESDKISYGVFMEDVIRLSNYIYTNYLHNINIALIGSLDYEWLLWYFSILLSGNTVVTIDHSLNIEEICALTQKTDVTIAVVGDRKWRDLSMRIHCAVVKMDSFKTADCGFNYSYGDLRTKLNEDKSAMIVFTSGTVGNNKGVLLSHKNIIKNVLYSVQIMGEASFHVNNSIIPLLPPFHMLQVTTGILAPIWYGVTLCLIKDFKQLKTGLTKYRPSTIVVVPTILEGLSRIILSRMKGIKYAGFLLGIFLSKILQALGTDARRFVFRSIHNALGGNLDLIVCGGAFVDEELLKWYDNIGITVLHGYGITECSPVVCCNQVGSTKPNSVGKTIPEFCMVKEENGELLVKGDIVFSGYYKNFAATEKAFSGEWFRTGDVGYIDEDGYIFLSGRKKNVLVLKNGNNVSPEEIERSLEEWDLVESALVYMNKSGDGLEADVFLCAEISCQMSVAAIEEKLKEILRITNSKLQKFKRLDSIHIAETAFERTALGKVKRRKYITEQGRKRL